MATVDLELVADLSKASKDFANFSKQASSSLDGVKSAFSGLAAIAGTALAAFSFKKITDAAIEQEKAINNMNSSLALTGEYSKSASQDMIAFADQLQKNSMYSDDTALSLVGLTKQLGATNAQTKEIIQAAADLSSVTGDSLDSSVEKLSRTLSGNAGRLAQTEQGLKGLTEQQLKSGVGIDIIAKKYHDMASQMTNTFGGAVQQTSNGFEDLLKAMGSLITQNPVFIKVIKLIGQGFNDLADYIKKNKNELINFSIDAIVGAVKGFAFLVDSMGDTVAIFKNFGSVIDLAIWQLGEFASSAIKTADVLIKSFKDIINLAISPVLVAINALAEGLKFMGAISEEQLGTFQKGLADITLNSDTSGLESLKKDVEDFTTAAREGFIESSDKLLETKDSFSKAAIQIDSFADSLQAMKKKTDESNKALQKLSDTNKELKNNIAFKDKTFLGGLITGQNIIDAGYATAGAITKGAAGANQLFSSGVGAASNLFLPGSGEAASAIAGLLAQGPEAAKAAVKGFIDQIPVIVQALADSMPVVAQTLAENSDEIIIGLVKGMPKVAEAMAIEVPIALAKALPGVFTSLAQELFSNIEKGLKEFFKNFAQGLINGIISAFSDIGSFFKSIGLKIWEGLKEGLGGIGKLFTEIFDKINPANLFSKIFKVDMGGRGTVEKTLGIDIPFMSFARGGLVPGSPVVQGDSPLNDRHLALLSAGEAIIPRSKMQNPIVMDLVDGILSGTVPAYGFGGFVKNTVSSIGGGISSAAKSVISTGGDILGSVGDEFKKLLNTVLGPLWDIVRDMVFNKMFWAMLDKNKFAQGGSVPQGFSNDTFPSLLSSGENVIDRSTNEKLNAFLEGASKQTKIVLQIGERELAEVILNLNRQGYRTA